MATKQTRAFSVTVTEQAYQVISDLCDLYDCSKSKLFMDLAQAEHSRITGDEKALKALELLKEFRDRLSELAQSDSDSDG